jgi:hypothetical protein
MPITLDGTAGITNDATDLNYTGTLTGGTGVINIGSGQLYKDASGNVGIGTSSPAHILDVSKNANESLVRINGSSSRVYFQSNASSFDIVSETSAGAPNALSLRPSGGAGLLIDSSGNLLVGTTSGSAKLHINGVGGSNGQALWISGWGAAIGAAATWEAANTSNADVMYFKTSAANVGKISITSTATSYVTSSDYRLKHDIQPMTGALAKVAQLKPVTYKWNADDSQSQGFIAHELQEVVPECVTGEKDAVDADGKPVYQGIDTSFLVATLTAALQEAVAEINSLKARVEALEGAQ